VRNFFGQMRDLTKLIDDIIPYPDDREHRDGFNNEQIIDGLIGDEKDQVENLLLDKLQVRPNDLLIVETLGYMKSKKSLDRLYTLLNGEKEQGNRIVIASSIYEIEPDDKLIDIALSAGQTLTNWWDLISIFYYFAKFKNKRTDDFVRQYFNHKDYLVSYNAKRSVGQ
jgi:hypothetical protein